jgi:glucose uptake protein GlcU
MPTSVFSGCSDTCGWIAAVICVLSFGSFGVPIKSVKVEVHPLVMQSYKTIVCFLTSWLVVFLGEEVRWSYWGIASGMFWVPGATCGIVGIRNAGLAVAVGIWSSIIVMTSFLFGFVFFKEQVRDGGETGMAFCLLLAGLVGMSRYSAPQSDFAKVRRTSFEDMGELSSAGHSPVRRTSASGGTMGEPPPGVSPMEIEPLTALMESEEAIMKGHMDINTKDPSTKQRIVFLGGRISLSKRQLGILGAVINGAWGGMNLIPLHFAKQSGVSGAGYIISYGGGALIVNTLLWVLFFAYYVYQKKSIQEAVLCLPKWHVAELWAPGLMAGLLYSLGNFTAILSVTYLGQGTGFSFCQMQLFVSGLWGVFYFHEIKGTKTIMKWFASAFVAVTGIICLSYEHVGGTLGHRR